MTKPRLVEQPPRIIMKTIDKMTDIDWKEGRTIFDLSKMEIGNSVYGTQMLVQARFNSRISDSKDSIIKIRSNSVNK